MKRFMIGQFDRFDINKYNRDFRNDFFGVEVTQMESLARRMLSVDWWTCKQIVRTSYIILHNFFYRDI